MKLVPVIGLEIHLQLKTKSKMFCGCDNHVDAHTPPNMNTCPICLGHPGTLPVPNIQAIRFAVELGLALHASIAPHSKFDRKHYFYPDLPKGYQISQYDLPVVQEGYLDIEQGGHVTRIGITRAHLEEDAAKNIHAGETSLVDFNRAGTPLIETVTEPDFTSPEQAKAFLQELRLLARALNISDADMEKGQMRCDANISLRQIDDEGNIMGATFNPKTEVKNINSFRNVERALTYEIERQTKMWESGTIPQSTTRGWDDAALKTVEQRTKEDAADYRYFPEPDIPPLELEALVEELRGKLPELPATKRARFVDEYGFSQEDARQLTEDPVVAEFTESVISELGGWLESQTDVTPEDMPAAQAKLMKMVANWIIHKLGGVLNERGIDLRIAKLTPENFAELITLMGGGRLTQAAGLKVLNQMLDAGGDPSHIMEEGGMGRMQDAGKLAEAIERVLANFPTEVERYRAGEEQLMKFFLGMVMKETEGNADPAETKNLLAVRLQ